MGQLSALQLRPNEIVTHNTDLENAMNVALSAKWSELRGIQVVSIALGSVTLPEEDQELIKQTQRGAALSNPTLAAGVLAGAQANAMEAAASNTAGAMTGFMGMGMAQGMGGNNLSSLYQMGGAQQQPAPEPAPAPAPAPAQPQHDSLRAAGAATPQPQEQPSGGATPKFCSQCGSPLQPGVKFCSQCGAKIQ